MFQNGFIKLHRKILDWEWSKDLSVFRLFIQLLLSVNYENKEWQGQTVCRGEIITSISHLAADTGLSEKQVRTALQKLSSTGEISIATTNRYSKITVNNYERYQGFIGEDENDDEGKLTATDFSHHHAHKTHSSSSRGQAKGTPRGKQRATTEEYKEIKENNISSTAAVSVPLGDTAASMDIMGTAEREWLSLPEEERRLRLMFS